MNREERKFSGRHFFLIMLGAFGIVIAANGTLAYFALGSFPGVEVANTYVASQQFEAKRRAQEALGWQSSVAYENGTLKLHLRGEDGGAVTPRQLILRIGSATTTREDQVVTPVAEGDAFVAPVDLGAGNKVVFVDAVAGDGTVFSQRHTVILP